MISRRAVSLRQRRHHDVQIHTENKKKSVLGGRKARMACFFRRQLVDKPHDIKGDSIVGSGVGAATTSRPPKYAVGACARYAGWCNWRHLGVKQSN